VQIGRNLLALAREPDPREPSLHLEQLVCIQLAQQRLINRFWGPAN